MTNQKEENAVTKAMEAAEAKTRASTFATLIGKLQSATMDYRSAQTSESEVKQKGDKVEKIAIAIDYLASVSKVEADKAYAGNRSHFLASHRTESSSKPEPYLSEKDQEEITEKVLQEEGLDSSTIKAFNPYYR